MTQPATLAAAAATRVPLSTLSSVIGDDTYGIVLSTTVLITEAKARCDNAVIAYGEGSPSAETSRLLAQVLELLGTAAESLVG